MRRLKLSVALLFILVAAALFGRQFFTTVSAGGNLGAPSGISASDGDYIDKVNVIWNAVRGATLYRIFRNTSNNSSTATDVGTTQANYFFDTTAQTGQTYFYWVRAENGVSIGDLSNGDQGVRVTGSFHSQFFAPLGPPPTVAGNQITAAKSSLGKTLFWDEQLSSTWTVSCGTCHRPSAGGSDPRTNSNTRNPGFDGVFNTADDVFGSPGVPLNNADGTYSPSSIYGFGEQVTSRKSPTYLNAGVTFNGSFWDGRASTVFRDPLTNQILLNDWGALESQAIVPPLSDAEMAHSNRNWTQISEQLSSVKPLALAENVPPSLIEWIDGRNYNELFQEAFGTPEITPSRIALAIAAHERTIISDRAPIDRYSANIESLTAQEDRGRVVFEQNDCTFCHSGPVLSNQNFHYIGVRPQIEDKGRGNVTGNSNDNGRFKSPSLRNLELRAPYMHNGRFATIEEVVEFYNRGGDFTAANKDPRVRPLGLSVQQRADLVAFLKRPMTDLRVKDELPPFDRPRLFTESSRVPQITGTGRAGTGAIVPQVMAIEPPILGNPSFTVAVSKGLGNAQAVLVIDSNDPGVGASIPSNGSFVRVGVDISSGGFASVSLPIPNNPALIGQTFFGRWYVTDADAENGFSVSQAFRFTIFGEQSAPNRAAFIDFDGDNKTDISIFRPSNGQWWHLRSSDGQNRAYQFGTTSDKIVPADFTGDGKIDTAFWRPSSGEWFILRSEDLSFYSFPFGANGDTPVPADYDGDGKAEAAVFRESNQTWFIQKSSGGTEIINFGASGDKPVVSDYDGDNKADIAIFRPNGANGAEWWIRRSSNATVFATQFGIATDKPTQGDFTGDGKSDIALYRPANGNWFILRSEDFSFFAFPFGANGDIPVSGDYDGDGRFDAGVFRPTNQTWFINRSTAGTLIQQFGQIGDAPVPNAFVP